MLLIIVVVVWAVNDQNRAFNIPNNISKHSWNEKSKFILSLVLAENTKDLVAFLLNTHTQVNVLSLGCILLTSNTTTKVCYRRASNTRHKSLKQTLFLSDFLEKSWDLYFTLFSPLKCAFSLPNVEPHVFGSTETTVIPKSTLEKGKQTQVFQDLWWVLQVLVTRFCLHAIRKPQFLPK